MLNPFRVALNLVVNAIIMMGRGRRDAKEYIK